MSNKLEAALGTKPNTFTDSDGDTFRVIGGDTLSLIVATEDETFAVEFYKADAETIISLIREAAGVKTLTAADYLAADEAAK
jgi:hypothetical protein